MIALAVAVGSHGPNGIAATPWTSTKPMPANHDLWRFLDLFHSSGDYSHEPNFLES